jgi:hypothetical protein
MVSEIIPESRAISVGISTHTGAQHGTADLDLNRRSAERNSAFRHDW